MPVNITLSAEDLEELGIDLDEFDKDSLDSNDENDSNDDKNDNPSISAAFRASGFVQFDPNGKWAIKKVKMSDLISKHCYERVFNLESTSLEYIGILSCMTDQLYMPYVSGIKFHKDQLGIISVCIDILSLALMFYLFGKLKSINQEFLTILDNNVIRMKDFTIQIKRL